MQRLLINRTQRRFPGLPTGKSIKDFLRLPPDPPGVELRRSRLLSLFRSGATLEEASKVVGMNERRVADHYRRFRMRLAERASSRFDKFQKDVFLQVFHLDQVASTISGKRVRLLANRPAVLVIMDVIGRVYATLLDRPTARPIRKVLEECLEVGVRIYCTDQPELKRLRTETRYPRIIVKASQELRAQHLPFFDYPLDFIHFFIRHLSSRRGIRRETLLPHLKEIEVRWNDSLEAPMMQGIVFWTALHPAVRREKQRANRELQKKNIPRKSPRIQANPSTVRRTKGS